MPRRTKAIRASALVAISLALGSVALGSPAFATNSHGDASPASIVKRAHPGAMLTVQTQRAQSAWQATHSNAAATSGNTLYFGGGTNSIGVMSGAKTKVYLVFLGNQWGTQSTDADGNAAFTGDPDRAASAVQQMFKGIGTNGETWSADLTQWCDGPGVANGATSCPANLPASQFVPYQNGGVLAGVWYDSSAASPSQASGHQLGQEAVNAAAHFGNTSPASNRNSYYVILSPHGTNPDDYQGLSSVAYCAWHTYNGDSTLSGGPVSSPYGNIAFSNQPYNMDTGQTCGTNFINSGSSGILDGFTMTLGHEWHEMMSDVDPNTGWSNPNSFPPNQENSDECAWLKPGTTGGAANISFGSFGTFAEQASWSNDTDSCAISHTIINHGNTVTVANPGSQSTTVNAATSLQIHASDSASGQTLTWSATGLPTGLSINSSTGLISGTPTTTGTSSVTVTATDTTGASGSATFSWAVATSGGTGGGIANGGFETGSFSGWTTTGTTSVVSSGAHTGSYAAQLGGTSATNGDSTAAQTFTVPTGNSQLSFFYNVTCPDTVQYDWATATLKDNTAGTTTTVLPKTCTTPTSGWTPVTAPVTAGRSYTLTLVSHDDNYSGDPTHTLYDDITLTAITPPPPNPIVNGGFESGTLSGWTTTGTTSTVNTGAHPGTYAAQVGGTTATNGDSTLAQTFTPTAAGTLSFWYSVNCPDTVSYDWATATLKDNTTGTTTTVLPNTCPTSTAWTKASSGTLTAGHSYTLTLTSHDDNISADPTNTLYDDITLS